jgi:hypothetical protein
VRLKRNRSESQVPTQVLSGYAKMGLVLIIRLIESDLRFRSFHSRIQKAHWSVGDTAGYISQFDALVTQLSSGECGAFYSGADFLEGGVAGGGGVVGEGCEAAVVGGA